MQRIANAMTEIYDRHISMNWTSGIDRILTIENHKYHDSDIPNRLPQDLKFIPYFRQPVSTNSSTVKISDEVPRDSTLTIDAVTMTYELEKTFKLNAEEDKVLR